MSKLLKYVLTMTATVGAASLWLAVAPTPNQVKEKPTPTKSLAASSQIVRSRTVLRSEPRSTRKEIAAGEGEGGTLTDQGTYGAATAALIAGKSDGRWVTQGDILVSESQLVDGVGDGAVGIVTLSEVHYWENGIVPYSIDDDVDEALIKKAVASFEGPTTVRFVEHNGEGDHVVFRAATEDKCESYLGRKGGEQEVIIGPKCTTGRILHELMHTLGFVHEQSREDRDDYIVINWDDVQPVYKNQFQKIRRAVSIPVDVPFDFDSILLYPSDAFSQNGRMTMVRRDGTAFSANRARLSDLDLERVRKLYAPAATPQ